MNTKERFWSKVDKSSGPDGCWLWMASKVWDGYGRFRLGEKTRRAHVVALEWAVGPCPPGKQACHSCRNRHCVNPAHLRWDTQTANQAERKKDGTAGGPRGENHRSAKLTAAQVLEIRTAADLGESHGSIARRYGVAQTNVSGIARRDHWKHLPEVAA